MLITLFVAETLQYKRATTLAGEDASKREPYSTAGGTAGGGSLYGKQFGEYSDNSKSTYHMTQQ